MITEPMTMLTDYLLAVITAYFGYRLPKQSLLGQNWSLSFGFLVIASIAGGTAHGFALILPQLVLTIIWKLTLTSVGIASYFLVRGTVLWSCQVDTTSKALQVLNTVLVLTYLVLIVFFDSFFLAAAYYGICFILVIIIRTRIYIGTSSPDYRYLLAAFGFGLLTGIIWVLQVQLASWFNHADLAHITQIGVVYYIYRTVYTHN